MARPSTKTYVALDTYHHPDGVVCEGESAALTDEQAARGLASGALVLAQQPDPKRSQPDTEE